MSLPLSVASVLQGQGAPDNAYDIYLNRSGINAIEVPKGPVNVEIGGILTLKFLNRGSPIHITITTSNAGMYTSFFHENLYIVDETHFSISINPDCPAGFFDIEIITGYGVMKATFRVEVVRGLLQPASQRIREPPLQPVARGRPHPLMISMGIALILYSAWLYLKIDLLNTASFLTLIIGAVYTWYRQTL
ncbi:MAG: hypothetical protein OS112_00030 [Methanoregula sp.]|nr:MAG: hypothetical protein OS112_00030 [Methanoregula sp.]